MDDMFSTDRRMLLTGLGGLAAGAFLAPGRMEAGSLEPPGPPEPTMLPLWEIEPRTAINAVNTPGNAEAMHVISQPGSYYLVDNLTVEEGKAGIVIDADDVRLDLHGFVLQSNNALGLIRCGDGGRGGIEIRNGLLRAPYGIDLSHDGGHRSHLESLLVDGAIGPALRVGPMSTILSCRMVRSTGDGIIAGRESIVVGCEFSGPSSHNSAFELGEESLMVDCGVQAAGHGISTGANSLVRACTVGSSQVFGIQCNDGTLVTGCVLRNAARKGIYAGEECLIAENAVQCRKAFSSRALEAVGSRNVIANNQLTNTSHVESHVLAVDGSDNMLVRNVLRTPLDAPPEFAAGNVVPIASPSSPPFVGDDGGVILPVIAPDANTLMPMPENYP